LKRGCCCRNFCGTSWGCAVPASAANTACAGPVPCSSTVNPCGPASLAVQADGQTIDTVEGLSAASSRLVRFVDQPHGRAQNRDSFGAAASHNATLADYGVPAEGDYRRPGAHPEDSLAVVRSARTHLTYGEWLRRGFDRRSLMLFLENSQLIRSVRTATRFRPSAVSAAATPRFVHKSVHNTATATGVSGP
jgi:hypothetical protein